jgi:hypothetical protein
MKTSNHDSDFYTWTQEQAALLRQGRWNEADIVSLIEELNSIGASEKWELENRLAVLIAHLLKWKHQPKRRGNSWRFTIEAQRQDARDVLSDNPGFKPIVAEALMRAYRKGKALAVTETRLAPKNFRNYLPISFLINCSKNN